MANLHPSLNSIARSDTEIIEEYQHPITRADSGIQSELDLTPVEQSTNNQLNLKDFVTVNLLGDKEIPCEIVSYIFQLGMDQLSSNKPLLVLAEVSRSWRKMVTSTPLWWSTVNLPVDRLGIYDLEIAKVWLSRSSTVPLSLRIYCRQNALPKDNKLSALIDLLKEHSDHWGDIMIGAHQDMDRSLFYPLFEHLQNVPTNFGVLKLSNLPHEDNQKDEHGSSMVQRLSPTHLKVYNTSTTGFTLSWERLTSLTIEESLYIHEILDIVKGAKVLRSFCVRDGPILKMSPAGLDPKATTSNSITYVRLTGAASVIKFLTLPSLKNLYYVWRWTKFNHIHDLGILSEFLSRSGPSLEEFFLSVNFSGLSPNLNDWFKHNDLAIQAIHDNVMREVTSLKFDISCLKNKNSSVVGLVHTFFSLLSEASDKGKLPNLHGLVLNVFPIPASEFWNDLCNFLQPPLPADPRCLEYVGIDCPNCSYKLDKDMFDKTVKSRLQEIKNAYDLEVTLIHSLSACALSRNPACKHEFVVTALSRSRIEL